MIRIIHCTNNLLVFCITYPYKHKKIPFGVMFSLFLHTSFGGWLNAQSVDIEPDFLPVWGLMMYTVFLLKWLYEGMPEALP